jgi:hypothetical protein
MISDGLLRRLWRSVRALAFVFCAVACVVRVHAQDVDDARYKELIDQALLEFKHRNWPEARVLFRRAHEISPNARTSRGMGVVSYEMRDYVQAVRDLSAALEDQRQPLTESQRTECQNLLSRSRTFVGVFDVRATPPEADLKVDGVGVSREPDGTVLLAFGPHVLEATAEGYESASVQVNVQGGESGRVDLVLVKLPEAPDVAATPDAGESKVARGPAPKPASTEAPKKGGLRYTWVALGVSAAFGGGAVASWVLGQHELDHLDDRCKERADQGTPCTKGSVSTSTVKTYERLTNAAIGVSAASLVAAGLLAYFEWPRERRLAVGLGPSSLSVRGEF